MRTILRAMLQGLGAARIHEADDGAAGLARLDETAPDVVLLDWAMPVMDGIAVLRDLRRPGRSRSDTRIIMITAFGVPAALDQAYAAGADEIISTPFSTRALHDAIERSFIARRPFVTRGDYFGPQIPGVVPVPAVDTAG